MDFDFGVPSRAHELFNRFETQGVAYVGVMVDAQKSEELFLDYKRITTKLSDNALSGHDRENFRKALSGFANSEGGVILWGVETERVEGVERLRPQAGYEDAPRFVTLLEDAVSGCTVPPVPGVRSIPILYSEGSTKGFVATLIPSSLVAPHQTSDEARSYYMRAGSSFKHVPHGVLAGMFGRRPSPEVAFHRRIVRSYMKNVLSGSVATFEIALELANRSGVVARNAYISWQARQIHSDQTQLLPHLVPGAEWQVTRADSRNGSVLADEKNRLAPYSRTPVLNLELSIRGEIKEPLDVDIYFGCESSPPKHYHFYCSAEDLQAVVTDLRSLQSPDQGYMKTNIEIGSRILNSSTTH